MGILIGHHSIRGVRRYQVARPSIVDHASRRYGDRAYVERVSITRRRVAGEPGLRIRNAYRRTSPKSCVLRGRRNHEDPSAHGRVMNSQTASTGGGAGVLLVEDDLVIGEFMANLLDEAGLRFLTIAAPDHIGGAVGRLHPSFGSPARRVGAADPSPAP